MAGASLHQQYLNYRRSNDQWIELAWDILDAAIVTSHNADGDELEGCRLCNPERPFTHREGCPVPRIEAKLNLRKRG